MLLRRCEPSDGDALERSLSLSQAEWAPWVPEPEGDPTPREMVERHITRVAEGAEAGTHLRLTAFLDDGRVAGYFSLNEIVHGAFWSAYAAWSVTGDLMGRGLGTEGARALLDIAFADAPDGLGLHRVQVNIIPSNARSLRIAEKLGLRREGLAIRYLKIAGRWQDHVMFATTREEQGESRVRAGAWAFLVAVLALDVSSGAAQSVDHLAIAKRVLSATPLIDGHNDLPDKIHESEAAPNDAWAPANDLRMHTPFQTDIARLRAGMVGGQFWSVYIPYDAVEEGAAKRQLEQIDIALQMIARYPDTFELARSASDVERIFGSGRIASLLGIEGGHAIEGSLGALRAYYDLGVRYMTLTHNGTLDWADAALGEHRHGGLTPFGREVVREMNRLGMLVDLSHTSAETMNDALDVSEAPVIWSHAGARGVYDHPRNVPDQVLRRVPDNGGVVMVDFYPPYLTARPDATISDVADHIDYVADVAGVDHVGIGSDFDGIEKTPDGLEDVSKFPALFAELSRRGWSEQDLAKLAGENILRVMREAERVASRLRRERPPSTATLEELDGSGGND